VAPHDGYAQRPLSRFQTSSFTQLGTRRSSSSAVGATTGRLPSSSPAYRSLNLKTLRPSDCSVQESTSSNNPLYTQIPDRILS